MNILILGSGGREYMLAWKICQSPKLNKLFIAPGNGGTVSLGTNVDINWEDFDSLKSFLLNNEIHMLVVGPEAPLVDGLVDRIKNDASLNTLKIIGPVKAASRLEGSKAYAKKFMQKYGIPTPSYRAFDKSQEDEAVQYIMSKSGPYVLKADGLAAGKGVLIMEDKDEAMKQAKAILNGKFGKAGNTLVIESYLSGLEFSVFALCSGKDYALLPVAKDYKRIGEGDTGLNTGGMGSISPVSKITSDIIERVEKKIIRPTLNGLASEGIRYTGFLFFGLMLSNGDPYVIEYNCRLGDPETQVVLPRIENDFIELLEKCSSGEIGSAKIHISPKTAFCTILASGGYPESYEKGKQISLPSEMSDVILAHAGTRREDGSLFTSGGRVIGVVGQQDTAKKAKELSQKAAEVIQFDRKYYRSDIGFDLNL